MTWWAIDVRTAPDRREQVGAWLVARTGQAVEEREDGTLVAELNRAEASPPKMSLRRLETVDWSIRWREGLGPKHFGRLTVTPSWVAGVDPINPCTVVLDPESAFGSGEHGSTRAALTLLERHLRPGHRVLDLGSGSGILAIAAAKLGAAVAIGIEHDAESTPVAHRNADRNGVSDRVTFLEGEAGDLAPLLGPADLILSNILRTANAALLPAIGAALERDGLAIFSGMEEMEAVDFRRSLGTAGFEVRDEAVDEGWWAVAASHS
ncbi:MAG: 50S ribosomal protein L11 methyltransferase [Gemmatimonadales bacterium]